MSSADPGRRPTTLNVSGPYAVGKDTILNALLERHGDRVHRVSTITTRPVSKKADPTYTHVEPDEFEVIVRGGNWIANYQLEGHTAYATDLDEIESATQAGLICVLSVFAGPMGAGALRQALGSRLLSLAVMPSTGGLDQQLDELRRRLVGRDRDSQDAIDRRLASQMEPIAYILSNPTVSSPDGAMPVFDRVVINQELAGALEEVSKIFAVELLGGAV